MNSSQIFEYSEDFLNEIIDNLMKLRSQKLSNPNNNDFDNKLKLILGKDLEITEFNNLSSLNDKDLRNKIIEKFKVIREDRLKILGENQSKEIEKRILLQSIDLNWKSHIQYLEQLRQVIGLRSYGQRDPLIEYKKEAFDLFENLLNKLKLDYVTILMNLKVVESQKEESKKVVKPTKIDPKYIGKKMSRNEPCLCGSGKKYKRCCGAL
jgi:preprotein translocase subunit SecA